MRFLIKVAITALVVAGVSEVSKRSSLMAAILVSLPLTSILALTWLYLDSGDVNKVSQLSTDILWMVIPSLLFFVVLPVFLKNGFRFWPSLAAACGLTAVAYGSFVRILAKIS